MRFSLNLKRLWRWITTRLASAKPVPLAIAATVGFVAATLTGAVTIGEQWEKLYQTYGPADEFAELLDVIDNGDNFQSDAALKEYFELSKADDLIADCGWVYASSIADFRAVRIDSQTALLVLGAYREGCLIPISKGKRTFGERTPIGWPEYIYVHDVSPQPPGKLIEIRNKDRWGSGITGMGSSFIWLEGDKLRLMTLPTYLLVAGGYSFKSYLAEFIMRSDVRKVDGRVFLRREGFVYECDQSKEQSEAEFKEGEEERNATTEEADTGQFIDTSWYVDAPACEGPHVTMKAMRPIGPEVFRYDPVSRQFDQIEGRRTVGGDLADKYGDKANATGGWFVKPIEINGAEKLTPK